MTFADLARERVLLAYHLAAQARLAARRDLIRRLVEARYTLPVIDGTPA